MHYTESLSDGWQQTYLSSGDNDDGTFRDDFKLYGDNLAASERQIPALGSILSTPCIANGIIYMSDSNESFYALRLITP